ncbi:hypothetical protein [Roseobacter sp. S98]|uniref:hypothetical protein n=1 Tax=Roseobacter algicola (ex Choi et al. 2025) (nom. illeg.) TaxID=3092138 RepID=UPI003F512D3B
MQTVDREIPLKRVFLALVLTVAVGGCEQLQRLEQRVNLELGGSGLPELTASEASEPIGADGVADALVPATGVQTAASLDRSSDAERSAARRVSSAGTALGETVASLGNPAEQGFWLKTPLVTVETKGVVTDRTTGRSASVTLLPIDGPATAGSRISLAALRVLEAPLTALVTLSVRRGG